MAYEIKVTNTKINPLSLFYRVPGEQDNRQLISIYIPSRALNYSVAFTDEVHYAAFKEQNLHLFEAGILLQGGKTKEAEAIRVNESNAKKEVEEIRKKKNESVEKFEKAVSTEKTKLKLKVEKDS